MSETKLQAELRTDVRQGRRPPGPPGPPGAGRDVRPRHRPGARQPPRPRHDAGAEDAERPAGRSWSTATSSSPWSRTCSATPIRGDIEHVDLVVVRRGEKVTVDVRVHVEGDSAPDTLVNLEAQTIELEVLATAIPEQVVVDVQGLTAGTQIHASDLKLPEGAELRADPELLDRQHHPGPDAPRRSRPSWPRPSPRPASSTRSTRRPTARSAGCCRRAAGGRRRGVSPTSRPLAGGRARQPRARLRRQPAQRRRDGARRAGRPDRRFGQGRAQGPSLARPGARGPARTAAGRAGRARPAHGVHERVGRPGRRRSAVLQDRAGAPARHP